MGLLSIYILSLVAGLAVAAESTRPRGVGPDFAKFYKSTKNFACISNPSVVIGVSQINDDFCDCPDGSDEPGTAACSHLSDLSPPSPALSKNAIPSLALPGFYCKNKGHQPAYIPFTHVNDGVCDYDYCCDGSDEWDSVGGITCEDRCKSIGQEWRKLDQTRKKSLSAAGRRRRELVLESANARKEVEERISTLGIELIAQESKVKSLEKDLSELERRERGKVVKGPSKGNKISILAGLAKDRIEELREFLIRVKNHRDIVLQNLNDLEAILSRFKDEYNPNFNDEGVKRAVRSWDDYIANKEAAALRTAESPLDVDLEEIVKADGEEGGGIIWGEWEGDEDDGGIPVLYQFEEYLPASARVWLDQKLRDFRSMLVENGILADNHHNSGFESKALMQARDALKSEEDTLQNTKTQLTQHKEDLEKDYGPDDVFRTLKGRCLSKDSGEYTYELCWLDRTTQKSKQGGGDTSLGTFVRFERVMVDEDAPVDGKGLGSGERIALLYENGQHCWNGPSRSIKVILACSEKDEIWKVAEEEKCVYRMEAGSPAACEPAGAAGGKETPKDEL
ncbi:MAG: hypothetical protein M1829_000549 [Trizodia sp. TS-e1964]|nr:MAG: hypothetical protein M1829_000549 [Trizodia sp. TS-e1964]